METQDDIQTNFHMVEQEIKFYMQEYTQRSKNSEDEESPEPSIQDDPDSPTASIQTLIQHIMDWYRAWAPPNE